MVGIPGEAVLGFGWASGGVPAKCGLRSVWKGGEELQGVSGEIGGRISSGSGGVLDAGSLEEGEAEVGCSWMDFRGEFDHSLTRDSLENGRLSPG